AQILEEERLLFAKLIGSSDNVHLSFPRFEMERARPRYASPFFLAVAEAMTGTNQDWQLEELPNHHRVPDSQPDPTLPTGSALWVEEVDLSVLLSSPSSGPREWTYLDRSTPHFRRLRNAVRCRAHSKLFTRYDGLLRKPESCEQAVAYLQGHLLSATALETYATCPQRFFMRNVLRVEVLDEPENVGELSPLERGTIIHEILQRFYEQLDAVGALPLERSRAPEYRDLLEKIALKEFANAEDRGVTGHLVGWKAYRRRLLEDLVRFLENELDNLSLDLVPSHFEFDFGRSSESPPVVIGGEGGLRLSFGGRIDRIDSGPDHARVIDYKSGKTLQARYKDNVSFEGGEQLQLPIYLLAAARALDLPEESVDASYYHINRQVDFRTVNLKGNNFRQRRGEFNYLVSGLADHIQRGIFVPQTGGGQNCRFCDFKMTCPAGVQRQEERKQGDENLASFLELKDIK
ncbi:MAG TPA: PD-(D/E)XK nuclease family protein, partial [Dehalococcoidia bacterium]|nr:PD-(D/E)XK nuclease family protein [Dehalococcoidia bacterium]